MRRQQNICRFVFVLFGVLPLLATLAYASWRNARFDETYFSDLCGRSFGCYATVRDVKYVRPAVLQLVEVNFSDSETGQPLLRCDAIDIQRDKGTLRLSIPNVEVDHAAGDQVIHTIHERILRQPKLLQEQVILSIGRLRFDRVADFEFSNNTIEFRKTNDGTEMWAELHPTDSPVPIDLTIQRNVVAPALTMVKLETRNHSLPVSLIMGPQNWLPQLTPSTTFQGNIWCDLTPSKWTGEVVGGFLRNVDLAGFLGESFGGWIEGLADITIRTTRFSDNRLEEVDVTIDSASGRIRQQQLTAATEQWQLKWTEQPSLNTEFVNYQQLECRLHLANGRIGLRGGEQPMGTLLTLATKQQLTTAPENVAYAAVSSISAVLFPGQPPHGPVSKEAERLLRVLPLSTIR